MLICSHEPGRQNNCVAALWQLRGARRRIPSAVYKSLVVSLMLSQLAQQPESSSAVRPQRGSKIDFHPVAVWSREASFDRTALAERS